MARALYSGVGIAGMSGSINKNAGGTTFGKNGVVRRRVVPVNPQTTDQQLVRAAFALLTTTFEGLTSGQQEAWESARTSSTYYYKQDPLTGVSRPFASAKVLFIAMNMNLMLANSGSYASPTVNLNAPGTPNGTDDIGITSLVADDSSNSLTLTYSGALSNESAVFYATPPVSAGVQRATSVRSQLRVIETVGVSPDTLAGYVARFPLTGQTGKKIYYEIWGIDGGTGKSRLIGSGFTTVVA